MKRQSVARLGVALASVVALWLVPLAGRAAPAAPLLLIGVLGDAPYRIQVPSPWNGTLVLYSHGYVPPGVPNPALTATDPVTNAWLLAHGYAVAGSAYSGSGWAVEEALRDQLALLDFFTEQVGPPRRTIAWGQSLGGLIAAALVQEEPGRFAGALPMCGVLAGGVAVWNESLDAAFTFKTLLAPDAPLAITAVGDGGANLQLALRYLNAAQQTPQGRARVALAAAFANLPGWFDAATPQPARDDYVAQQRSQYLWSQRVAFLYVFGLRGELEGRAGGNPSWNTGVDYRAALAASGNAAEVRALYQGAGLSLDDDLAVLERAPRIDADPDARAYLARYYTFNGQLAVPVLTMHTTADGLVRVQNEQAYASVVAAAGHADLLRQVYVRRAGHCAFTPAEVITAFQSLVHRLDSGRWGTTPAGADLADAASLNRVAAALGADENALGSFFSNTTVPTLPAFVPYQPSPFIRPFDAGPPRPVDAPSGPPVRQAEAATGLFRWALAGLGGVLALAIAGTLVARRRL